MDLTYLIGVETPLPDSVGKDAHSKASSLPGRDEVGDDIHWGHTGAIDDILQNRTIGGVAARFLQDLTDRAKSKQALQLPVLAGTRVLFAHNLGSVLAYTDIPDAGVHGTVVTVRSADGDITSYKESVHVMWDDGTFRAVAAEHLRVAKAQKQPANIRMGFSSMGGISHIFDMAKAGSTDDLVHKATRDLWSCSAVSGGGFVVERLFTDKGQPLKV